MLEQSIAPHAPSSRRAPRLQTLASTAAGLLILAGCADADFPSALAEPAATTLRAEVAGPSFDVAEAAKRDPSWSQCDEIWEFRSHAEGDPGAPHVVKVGEEIHPQVTFDTPWKEPVQLIAFKNLTDNAKILHHWIFYNGQTMIGGWAPGRAENTLPPDVGMEMLPGTLRLDMHYYNLRGSKDELDRSGLALCIVKGANKRTHTAGVYGGFSVLRNELFIPPNARGFATGKTCKVTSTSPITLLRVTPHAHQHARHMTLKLKRGDGTVQTLHDDSFNFEEQVAYELDPLVKLNPGDEVTATCTYDNETNKSITWGENTDQEMCFLWSVYYPKGGLLCTSGVVTPTPPPAAVTTPAAPAATATPAGN